MPRALRSDFSGQIYHALNRGNARNNIFFKDSDFEAFERVIKLGLEKYPVDLIAYQWMSNHWHMVLSPQKDKAMSAFLGWVTMTHTQRYHAHNKTTGYGHVYQGRYKSFPVQDDEHFHTVCRYVERNALTAGIVDCAEDYRWGSLWNWCGGDSDIKLSAWPVKRLRRWADRVNEPITKKEKDRLQNCIQRGCPFGNQDWVAETAKQQGLEITLRPRGRPKKLAQNGK
jgi:putative transposase